MYQDFKDLLKALNAHKVKYLVVGGYAVVQHAQPRATKDLDILIQPAPMNGAALFRALQEFGAPLQSRLVRDEVGTPLRNLTARDFIKKGTYFTMGAPPVAIDILPEIKGITFARAWKNRVTEIVDAKTGLTAHFISRDDLISAKLASARPQDLADVEAIRRAQAVKQKARAPSKRGSSAEKLKVTRRRKK